MYDEEYIAMYVYDLERACITLARCSKKDRKDI